MAEWWDIETEFFVKERGIEPDKARIFVIMRWMWSGDFRPLIAAIDAGQELDPAVLNVLVSMLEGDKKLPYYLKAVPRGRGRPQKPEHFARNLVAARAYEAGEGKSEEAFEHIAKAIGKSDRTVRQAVTAWRKARRNRAK